ncbi:general stress protein [Paenibacillus sp. IB182496]|uniref:General stress protein n=1 Tax=Paenibacillus sabuli TaxID=2772509 RepID=A0A927BRG0_9BACL|nr:general stress protein [Paenibacillus sabuli]MBD2844912.1 general stress protein [Paenibacillus sabuli]
MSRKIAVFQKDEDVIETVEELQRKGFGQEHLKVLGKDHEHTRRVEEETGIDAEEIQDLAETREEQDATRTGLAAPFFLGGMGTGGTSHASGTGAAPYAPAAGVGLFGWLTGKRYSDDDEGIGAALRALGLKKDEAHEAREAVRAGDIVVMVESDDDAKLDEAEAVYRSHNATRLL